MDDQEAIRKLYNDLTEAQRRKDVDAAIAPFADASVMFLLPPPLSIKTGENAPGAEGIKKWFDSFESEIGLDFTELQIVSGVDVAFLYSLVHLTGKRADKTDTDVWYRETLGLRKINGEWKIVHQHQSVPMYMDGSNKAASDLKP